MKLYARAVSIFHVAAWAFVLAVPPAGLASERSHSKVLAAFREVVSEPSKSTAQVFCDGRRAALGAVVGADGYILTKASELRGKLECQLHDARRLPATLIVSTLAQK